MFIRFLVQGLQACLLLNVVMYKLETGIALHDAVEVLGGCIVGNSLQNEVVKLAVLLQLNLKSCSGWAASVAADLVFKRVHLVFAVAGAPSSSDFLPCQGLPACACLLLVGSSLFLVWLLV